LERTPLKSSLIKSVGYDAASQTLEIEFQPSPKQKKAWEEQHKEGIAPGPVFQYGPCAPATHAELTGRNKYDSAGRYFLREIKPVFDGRKVEAETKAQAATPPDPEDIF
jgi:hypothetical protein